MAVRFNFRGVGASAGATTKAGRTADDLLAVVQRPLPPKARWRWPAFVWAPLSPATPGLCSPRAREIARRAGGHGAARRFNVAPCPEAHAAPAGRARRAGDDTVPLAADVMDWAPPVPAGRCAGGGALFHGQLPLPENLARAWSNCAISWLPAAFP